VLNNVSFRVNKGDKIAFVGENEIANTTLFKILMGEIVPDEGKLQWGVTTTQSYFPKDNTSFFEDGDVTIIEWLEEYSKDKTVTYLRGFLGRMLFSGDDVYKHVGILSGGEKVRCMLSRMMMSNANVLVLDQPTNHLDLESITALNNGLVDFKGIVLFSSHDHQFIQTIANRIIEFTPKGVKDKMMTYDEYVLL
jgi:ATPase subunit of ABC transporter with duplicated ATPase domains